MGIKNRQAMARDHWEWWKTVMETKVHKRLAFEKNNKFYASTQNTVTASFLFQYPIPQREKSVIIL